MSETSNKKAGRSQLASRFLLLALILVALSPSGAFAAGFTNFGAAAVDQYGTATGTVSTPSNGGNLGNNGTGTPGGNGSNGSNGSDNPHRQNQGNKGAGAGNQPIGGEAGIAGSRGALPFTGLNLVTLLILALTLAAVGLFLRTIQRGMRGRTARSRT